MRSPARRLSPLALVFLLVIGLAPATAAAGTPTDAQISAAEQSVLTLTNRRRASAGLTALRWDNRLAELAGDRAAYMARTGQFSHTQSGGTDVFDMIAGAGIKWYGAGEIIAWNTAAALDYSAAFAVKGWMGSPSHKAIVMSKGYNYVGFGLAISDTGKRYWAGVYLKGPDRTGAWSKIVGTAKRNLNNTDVRVWVKWTGSDVRLQVLTSGFRYYQVQRSINGGAWSSYPVTTKTTMTRTWRRNSTYDVRVRSRDRAGNWGAWKTTTIKT